LGISGGFCMGQRGYAGVVFGGLRGSGGGMTGLGVKFGNFV